MRSGVQLRLRLPFVTRDQVDLARSGDELVVTVGSYRRLLTLPASLARLRVTGARVDDEGVLRVSFDGSATPDSEGAGRMTPPQDEPVGSVGDEAAKLLGALADWAGDRRGDRVRDVNEHIATGDAECLYCPICRTVHAVREASPEVKAQLADGGVDVPAGRRRAAGRGRQRRAGAGVPGAAHRPGPTRRRRRRRRRRRAEDLP